MGATQSHERLDSAPRDAAIPAMSAQAKGESGEPEPGSLIANRYRLLERIHAGSAGALYRAEDLAFSRPVALRLLTPALSRDEAVLARLQARLQATAAMARDDLGASSDIVDLTDLGRADSGLVFVVTEFLAGENLGAQLAREGPLAWPALRPLMVRACQIVHLSHQHGLLRLDLQTRHLYPVRDKTSTSTLKVLSPGIGDVFGDSLWSSFDPSAAAVHLQYAAPEQVTGGSVDARTDIYALGIIMYELLSGRVPFPDTRPAYVCARHLLEPPPPFSASVRATTPEAVVSIVARALAKQPEDRWPTMRALANAMAAIDFGPCDASGVLEVDHSEPLAPATSSTSMRIDLAGLHTPSPAVRPKTMPPHGAFMLEVAELTAPAPTGALIAGPVLSASPEPVRPWFTLPDQDEGGSSSRMAWDEILAAADEAVAAVAAGTRASGTAGDSGVFLPERLLYTGEAATASTVNGRVPPISAQSRADTLVMPASLLREPPVAGASHTQRPAALHIDDSAGDLPTPAILIVGAGAGEWRTRPDHSDAAAHSLAAGPAPEDSAVSMSEVAERSATVWPIAARSQVSPRRTRPYAWAAAAVLAIGTAAAGLRLLRPHETAPVVATPHAQVEPADAAGRRIDAAIPAAVAPRRPLAADDLSSRTASPASPPPRDPQWIEAAAATSDPRGATARPVAPAGPTITSDLSSGTARPALPAAGLARGPGGASPTDAPARKMSLETGSTAGALAGAAAMPGPAKPSPDAPSTAASGAPPSDEPTPPTPARKSVPSEHLPDAGHELAAPLDHDPLHAASLLERAEQAAGRGERALALSLALKSYHAQPNPHALRVAGELACKLGDAGKARWARDHLVAGERGTVEAACKAADLALE